MHQKVQKKLLCDVTKIEYFDKKNFLLYRKTIKKVHLNIFASVGQNPLNDVVVGYADCYSKGPGFKSRVSHGHFQKVYNWIDNPVL
jgi:hypothetical protein